MTDTALEELYRETILEHSKRPRRAGLREPFDAQVHQVNPVCGDEVTLRLRLGAGEGADRVVEDVSYDAQGCSISQAATSVMAEAMTGRTVVELPQSDDFELVNGSNSHDYGARGSTAGRR